MEKETKEDLEIGVEGTDLKFCDLSDLRKAYKTNQITIKVAQDLARQWVLNGKYATPKQRFFGNLLVFIPYIFGLFLIVYPIIIRQYWDIILILPAMLFFMIMNPIARKTTGCFNIFIYLGFGALIYSFFVTNQTFYILLSSTVLVNWIVWEVLSELAVSSAIQAVLKYKDIFLAFKSANAIFIEPGPNFGVKNPDICLHCGEEVSENAIYCKNCGEKVRSDAL